MADRPKQDGVRQDKANQEAGKPAGTQLAAANAKGKSTEPGKRPNDAKTHAKDKGAQAAAKTKAEHPKKPGGKDAKQDHEKAG
jgi:hypothetical protein